jgi:hypothetical protein
LLAASTNHCGRHSHSNSHSRPAVRPAGQQLQVHIDHCWQCVPSELSCSSCNQPGKVIKRGRTTSMLCGIHSKAARHATCQLVTVHSSQPVQMTDSHTSCNNPEALEYQVLVSCISAPHTLSKL